MIRLAKRELQEKRQKMEEEFEKEILKIDTKDLIDINKKIQEFIDYLDKEK